jgi:predicted  nucleic acid-binding Zn-ribbon protein
MEPGRSIESALSRLVKALDSLEAATNRRVDASAKTSSLEAEVQKAGEDRSNLAQNLDRSEARSARLADVNKEVSKRLVAAMESIRSILDGHEGNASD